MTESSSFPRAGHRPAAGDLRAELGAAFEIPIFNSGSADIAIESRVLDSRREAAESRHDYEKARVQLALSTGTVLK